MGRRVILSIGGGPIPLGSSRLRLARHGCRHRLRAQVGVPTPEELRGGEPLIERKRPPTVQRCRQVAPRRQASAYEREGFRAAPMGAAHTRTAPLGEGDYASSA